IEKVARAFRSDLRIVIENDGRAEYPRAVAGLTCEYRENSLVRAGTGVGCKFRGRLQQRNKRSALQCKQQMCRSKCRTLNGPAGDGLRAHGALIGKCGMQFVEP